MSASPPFRRPMVALWRRRSFRSSCLQGKNPAKCGLADFRFWNVFYALRVQASFAAPAGAAGRGKSNFCFRMRKNRKMLENGVGIVCISFRRVFHNRAQNPAALIFPSFTQFPQGFPQGFALFHRFCAKAVEKFGSAGVFSDNGKEICALFGVSVRARAPHALYTPCK